MHSPPAAGRLEQLGLRAFGALRRVGFDKIIGERYRNWLTVNIKQAVNHLYPVPRKADQALDIIGAKNGVLEHHYIAALWV